MIDATFLVAFGLAIYATGRAICGPRAVMARWALTGLVFLTAAFLCAWAHGRGVR